MANKQRKLVYLALEGYGQPVLPANHQKQKEN